MERRIDHLEDRLRALSGALRLRGVWHAPDVTAPQGDEPAASQVHRLRRAAGTATAG